MLGARALKAFEIFAESPPIKALKRNATVKRGGKMVKDLIFPQSPAARYWKWLERRLDDRKEVYDIPLEPGLITFVSTVWNTPVEYLKPLAESLLGQRGGGHFEWVLLDNGSVSQETIDYLETLRNVRQVKLLRVSENKGIIGGMRICLESSTGRYIVPVDSDDYLYPDAAQILTWHLQRDGYPPLVYTDEDKLIHKMPVLPFMKPDWDPVLFANACYIAHLCAIDREKALQLGAYTDSETNGSHDWDTFVRFVNAGFTPNHIPEITYSWRVHPQSTAGNISSKGYIHSSHTTVLNRWLEKQPLANRFTLEPSPLFSGTPDWRARRLHVAPRELTVVVFGTSRMDADAAIARLRESGSYPVAHYIPFAIAEESIASLTTKVNSKPGTLVAMVDSSASIADKDWAWEALGLLELFPDTVMVGGRLTDDAVVFSAGAFFGFGRTGCESPDKGRAVSDSGYFATILKQRTVSAVSAQFSVVDGAFLTEALREIPPDATIAFLGAWLGAAARMRGRRVVYSPFLVATVKEDWEKMTSAAESRAFLQRNAVVIPDYQFYSRDLSLDQKNAYLFAARENVKNHLAKLFTETESATPR